MAKNPVNKLSVDVRTTTGKGASRRARREGRVPVVLYGHGSDPQHLELNAHDFAAVLRKSGTNAVLTLDIEGTEQLALTKAIEVHPIRRNIQHADLLVVRRGEKVVVEVNVHLEGDAASGTLVTQGQGVGVVVALPGAQRMEVLFTAGQKLLSHDRAAMAARPGLARPPASGRQRPSPTRTNGAQNTG